MSDECLTNEFEGGCGRETRSNARLSVPTAIAVKNGEGLNLTMRLLGQRVGNLTMRIRLDYCANLIIDGLPDSGLGRKRITGKTWIRFVNDIVRISREKLPFFIIRLRAQRARQRTWFQLAMRLYR
jgi:hypothetical protein